MKDPKLNKDHLQITRTVASEQEFNSKTFGIRGKIDAVVAVWENGKGEEIITALEMKTGTWETGAHWGQVLIYCLLLSEWYFAKANKKNLLVYVTKGGRTYYIEPTREELCILIMWWNELGKF